jgi:hypothetical protein
VNDAQRKTSNPRKADKKSTHHNAPFQADGCLVQGANVASVFGVKKDKLPIIEINIKYHVHNQNGAFGQNFLPPP